MCIRDRVNNAAKAVESPTINVVAPLTTIAPFSASYAPLRSNSLYTNTPIINEYTTETTAASVGVNFPQYIPPKIITGDNIAQKASIKAFQISDRLFLSSLPL